MHVDVPWYALDSALDTQDTMVMVQASRDDTATQDQTAKWQN